MEVYNITKEQILEGHDAACNEWKKKIENWFPDVFKHVIQKGKVYKSLDNDFIFLLTDYNSTDVEGYGFLQSGNWFDRSWNVTNTKGFFSNYREATKEEWFEALKREAERRGFKVGGYFIEPKNMISYYGLEREIRGELQFHNSNDLLKFDKTSSLIFNQGVWGTVVNKRIPTQEEIDMVLDYLKNKK